MTANAKQDTWEMARSASTKTNVSAEITIVAESRDASAQISNRGILAAVKKVSLEMDF